MGVKNEMSQQPVINSVSTRKISNGFIVTPQSTGSMMPNQTTTDFACLTFDEVVAKLRELYNIPA